MDKYVHEDRAPMNQSKQYRMIGETAGIWEEKSAPCLGVWLKTFVITETKVSEQLTTAYSLPLFPDINFQFS